jgi:hypothetical protein
MTELQMIYVASIAGAVLFFIAGAATAALRRREAPAPAPVITAAPLSPVVVAPRDDAELHRLRAAVREAEARASAADVRAATADARTRDAEGRTAAVDARTREVEARVREAETRVREAETRVRDADGRVRDAEARVRAAEARATATAAELTAARAAAKTAEQAAARAGGLAAELERAKGETSLVAGETAGLATRVAELERTLAERVRAQRDLSTENEQLKGKLRDADAIRAEYVRLRTAATDADFLKREVERLEGELRTLHVEALGHARPRAPRGSVQPPTAPAARAMRTISESLATTIDRFADDGTRSIAVADTMGFPLAANGPDGGALAAYAALLMESATKSRQFLPVAAPTGIELVDVNGTRVSVWAFEVEGDRLLLANLAVTPVDARRLETTLADLSAILTPTTVSTYT